MDYNDETGLLIKAVNLSANRHRSQRRKDKEGSAYVNHPVQVMELLWQVGGVRDSEVLIAALLHDTIEDTVKPNSKGKELLEQEIRDLFGQSVLDLVLEVTDDKRLNKDERKLHQEKHAQFLSPRAKLIKLADKTCNVRDIAEHPPQFWCSGRKVEYLDWAESVVKNMGSVNQAMEDNFHKIARECRKRIQ